MKRRPFLKSVAGVAALASGLLAPFRATPIVLGDDPSEQAPELSHSPFPVHGGFVLLPWNEPIPAFVQKPTISIPRTEAIGPAASAPDAVSRPLRGPDELAKAIGSSVRTVSVPTNPAEPSEGWLLVDGAARPTLASWGYVDQSARLVMSMSCLFHPMTPFPVHPGGTPADGIIEPELLPNTPTPGIGHSTPMGKSVMWVEESKLYTLIVSNSDIDISDIEFQLVSSN